jgi:hypothetical protein
MQLNGDPADFGVFLMNVLCVQACSRTDRISYQGPHPWPRTLLTTRPTCPLPLWAAQGWPPPLLYDGERTTYYSTRVLFYLTLDGADHPWHSCWFQTYDSSLCSSVGVEVHKPANTEHDQGASHRYCHLQIFTMPHCSTFFLHVVWNIQLINYSFNSFCVSLGAESPGNHSGNLSGNEDVVSLSDIIPETNICFVSNRSHSSTCTHTTLLT